MILAEIPDSSGADCPGNLPLVPGCTPWQIWNSPSGFGPEEQSVEQVESHVHVHGNISMCLFHIFMTSIISTRAGAPGAIVRPCSEF